MPDDIALPIPLCPVDEVKAEGPQYWSLLRQLESGGIGQRAGDGSIALRRRDRAGCFLYGPYLHLEQGDYRLKFRCRSGMARLRRQPVLGIEIIILSRFQQQWRDFTADELAAGEGAVDFTVPYEHSRESANEGRFEFRFFHLGNADLAVTEVELERLPQRSAAAAQPRRWRLLGRLSKTWLGRRSDDGAVKLGILDPVGVALYGGWPYLRLPRGDYRLLLHGSAVSRDDPQGSVLGVEILARSRWRSGALFDVLMRRPVTNGAQIAWREAVAGELAVGPVAVDFSVPTELSLEAGADAPFEIRIHYFGQAALRIDRVDLVERPAEVVPAPPSVWRLLGRLRQGRIGEWRDDRLSVRDGDEAALLLGDRRGSLRLPAGRFQVCVKGTSEAATPPDAAVFRIEIGARANPEPFLPAVATPVATAEIAAGVLRAGEATLDFNVPAERAVGAGNWRYGLDIRNLGAGGYTIEAVDVVAVPDEADAEPAIGMPALRPGGRRKIVIIGNCQSETLRQGFAHTESLNRLFEVKYHFVQLPQNLHEFAARDLETCDIVLAQDIRLWDEFPLRDRIRPGADIIRYPLVRFASLWPFDSWNGPGDKEAYDREAPNLTFPYLDGLLGRLRKEIPDPGARLEAYRQFGVPGVINYRRLHEMEVKRLVSIDRKYDVSIGDFILENFRKRRVFHTTVRPNWEVFEQMIAFAAREVGAKGAIAVSESMDVALRNPQIPIHPKVARDLGVTWADENTRYLNRGVEITWETYTREYIAHYG